MPVFIIYLNLRRPAVLIAMVIQKTSPFNDLASIPTAEAKNYAPDFAALQQRAGSFPYAPGKARLQGPSSRRMPDLKRASWPLRRHRLRRNGVR
jgi:hypothetical protein